MRRRAQLPHLRIFMKPQFTRPSLAWRQRRCGRVLTVELSNESSSDIQRIRRAHNALNLCYIKDEGDSVSLGKSIEGLADVILNRAKDFIPALLIGRLRVLAFALKVLF